MDTDTGMDTDMVAVASTIYRHALLNSVLPINNGGTKARFGIWAIFARAISIGPRLCSPKRDPDRPTKDGALGLFELNTRIIYNRVMS